MATILVTTFIARRKGLKPSSVAGKYVKDQIERVNRWAIGLEAPRKPPLDKWKGKWRRFPRKN